MHDQPNPLQGKRILVTRPAHQNQLLTQLIKDTGAQAIQFPVIEIVAPHHSKLVQRKISTYNHLDWIIFTSANAVSHAIQLTNNQLPINKNTKIAAIGHNTAACLKQHHIKVDLIPEISNSEGLASALRLQQIEDNCCLIIKGEGGRSILADLLTRHGSNVTIANVYRRICPDVNANLLLDQWRNQTIDFVTVTSVEALNNLIQLIGKQGFQLLETSTMITISQRVHDAALNQGLSKVVTATSTSDRGMIESIVQIHKIGLKSTPRVQSN